jgi:hypothetical protein
MGTLQSDTPSKYESKHEKQLWQRIENGITAEFEFRRLLVSRFSAEALQSTEMSKVSMTGRSLRELVLSEYSALERSYSFGRYADASAN